MKPRNAETEFEKWQLSMPEDCRNKQDAVPFRAGFHAASDVFHDLDIEEGGGVLKPCPFCGSEAAFGEVTEGENFGGQFIECTNPMCGCSTCLKFPAMDSVKELLAEVWNNRAAQPMTPTNR